MKILSLQSGSSGNCIYLESGGTQLLFDAGISGVCAQNRLLRHGIDIRHVHGLFITHDHRDHTASVNVFHRRFKIPIWMTTRTMEAVRDKGIRVPGNIQNFSANTRFRFRNLSIEAISTTHDAADGVCFVVDDGSVRFGICTDLGTVFPQLPKLLDSLDGVLLESNYDPEMLENGFYSAGAKARITSDFGHISNFEAATLLAEHGQNLKCVMLGHISHENNTEELVLETHRQVLGRDFKCVLAPHFEASEIVEI
ncbi:MAG: MBL fold metallo-hydrolase [Planctomycetaceae bacterium]|nr:MBL fold metallo-hydrolase [Planctomycetaceae bacterium]